MTGTMIISNPVLRLVLLALVAATGACGRSAAGSSPEAADLTQSDRQAIEALAAGYSAHGLAGDLDQWLELFRADAVRMNPGMPALTGREAIRDWIHSFEFTVVSHQMTVAEVEGTRELAYARGTYRSELSVRVDGEEVRVPDEGTWLAVVRRDEQDAWRFYRFIYDTDTVPAPAAADAAVFEFTALNYAFAGPAEIPSGWVTFRMPNPSDEHHVLVLVRLPEGVSYADWQEASEHRAETGEPPAWAGEQIVMGGPGAVAPGLVGETTVYLEPGEYVMTCGVKTADGEYHSTVGMHRALAVREEDSGAPEPEAEITLTLRSHEFEQEGVVTAGRHTIRVHFEDQPELQHDVHVARLEAGQTVEGIVELMKDPREPIPFTFIGGAEQMPAGQTAYLTADFEPGRYAWACHYHADKGMVQEFTVSPAAEPGQ